MRVQRGAQLRVVGEIKLGVVETDDFAFVSIFADESGTQPSAGTENGDRAAAFHFLFHTCEESKKPLPGKDSSDNRRARLTFARQSAILGRSCPEL